MGNSQLGHCQLQESTTAALGFRFRGVLASLSLDSPLFVRPCPVLTLGFLDLLRPNLLLVPELGGKCN